MSELSRIDFYCGSGIATLFRKNKNISPSFIEIVSDEGRKSSGIFYNFKTPNNNEAIIYIKCNSKHTYVKNMSECWKFSLSQIEKEKIQKQINKGIPLFILLVCLNNFTRDDINGEAALLNIKDYEIISQRSDICIGFWHTDKKKRSFYIKNNKGNGLTEDYYFRVKRNLVETASLDDLIEEYYPDYVKNNQDDLDVKSNSNTENESLIQNKFEANDNIDRNEEEINHNDKEDEKYLVDSSKPYPLTHELEGTIPYKFSFNGETEEISSYQKLLLYLCEKLYNKDQKKFEEIAIWRKISGRKKAYIVFEDDILAKNIHTSYKLFGTKMILEQTTNTKQKVDIILKSLEIYNISKDSIKVYLKKDERPKSGKEPIGRYLDKSYDYKSEIENALKKKEDSKKNKEEIGMQQNDNQCIFYDIKKIICGNVNNLALFNQPCDSPSSCRYYSNKVAYVLPTQAFKKKKCPYCNTETKEEKLKVHFTKNTNPYLSVMHQLSTFKCKNCNKNFIHENLYKTYAKTKNPDYLDIKFLPFEK